MLSGNSIENILTVDVEDYFHTHAFSKIINPENWDFYECRVEKNTYRILDILDESNFQKATFFVLGWVAERYSSLVNEISIRGHEVASHGYMHKVIYNQFQKEFREDVRKSKRILEDIIGKKVIGYRAPTYSITRDTLWALNVLYEEGYLYDSSIFPVRHDYYGIHDAPRFPFVWNLNGASPKVLLLRFGEDYGTGHTRGISATRKLFEFPLSTVRILGQNIPVAGGGYFRIFPYYFTILCLQRINKKTRQPFIFYLHPWELDPEQPKIKGNSLLSRFRQYYNLDKTEKRFRNLLDIFSFNTIASFL